MKKSRWARTRLYWFGRDARMPLHLYERIDDVLGSPLKRDVELRVTPSLPPLRDQVLDSSLQFSINRFRNAPPLPRGYSPKHSR